MAHAGSLSKRTLQHIKSSLSAIFKLAKQQGLLCGGKPSSRHSDCTQHQKNRNKRTPAASLRSRLFCLCSPNQQQRSSRTLRSQAFAWRDSRDEMARLPDGEIHVTQSIWEGHTTEPKAFQSKGAVPV